VRRVLIDTNVYSAFMQNANQIVSAFQKLDYIAIDITVLGELFSGFSSGNREKQNRNELEQFINTPRVVILNHDPTTAEFYSQIIKNLKKKGTPIPTNDIWIAATSMQHGLWLFTMDRHFTNIPGIMLKSDY
jgi:tRNA(fMet)-specific endonuclease VapC